jgi:hypothetical protein
MQLQNGPEIKYHLIVVRCLATGESKSKSHYDRRPVGQCVLVSSPVWGSWPDVNYCLTVTVLSKSGAPSDVRSSLSFVLVTWTASVQYSKFAAGPRQHSISPYITPGERVVQLYPQALGSSGTSGVPFRVPTIVGP